MTIWTKRGIDIYAPYDAAGKPRSPELGDAQTWTTEAESAINAGLSNGGLIYDARAHMDADLAHDANASAWVIGDDTAANNGIYRKIGTSGTGSWDRVGDLPYSVLYAQNGGAGTANAIEATSSMPVSTAAYSQLISVPFTAENTGAMTLSINGETPRDLVTNTGTAIPAGYIKAGMSALVQIDTNGDYRLFSYGDATAIQAAAEAARDAASDFADDAAASAAGVNLPAITQDDATKQWYVKRNADGMELLSNGYVHAGSYGYKSSASSQSDALAAAITKAASLPHKSLLIPAGTAVFSKAIDFSPLLGGRIILAGEVEADFTDVTEATDFTNGGFITALGGALVALPALDSSHDPLKGDCIATFSEAPDLASGDRFCVYNPTDYSYTGFRPYYRAGEWLSVENVDGNVANLFGSFYADYGAADVDLYKHPNKPLRIGDGILTIRESADANLKSLAGFKAERIVDSDFSAIRPTNSGYAGMYLNQCIGIHGIGYKVKQYRTGSDAQSQTNYGLVIGNCQDINVEGDFEGGRHAVSTGGQDQIAATVCRNFRLRGAFRNSKEAPATTGCANTHGNAEYVTYEGIFDGGLSLGGNHITVRGVARGKVTQSGVVVYMSEMSGTDYDFSDMTIYTSEDPDDIGRGVIDIGGNGTNAMNANTLHGGTINLDGVKFDCPAARTPVKILNRGFVTTEDINITMRGGEWLTTSASSPLFAWIGAISGSDIDHLDISNIINGADAGWSIAAGTKVRGWRDGGTATITPATSAAAATAAVTFSKATPKVPRVSVHSKVASAGGQILAAPWPSGESATGFTANIRTASGDNFGSTDAGSVVWEAVVDEW